MGEFMGKRLGTKTLFLPVKSVQLKQHCVSFFFFKFAFFNDCTVCFLFLVNV